jgi:lipoprotein-anchoring transpeptidase ErfK/SrfK
MTTFSRRTFLKLSGVTLAGAVLGSRHRHPQPDPPWPQGPENRLGRGVITLVGRPPVISRPHRDGKLLYNLDEDQVVHIRREVVGLGVLPHNHVWFELDDGFVYSSYLQPVMNLPNTPLATLPADGVWSEVSIPYVDARVEPSPGAAIAYRLYYSTIFKVIEITPGQDGSIWYRVYDENGTRMYAPAAAFRPIPEDELTPLSPTVDPAEKSLVVYLKEQALSAFEGAVEVFRTRISSGDFFFGEDGTTLLNGTPSGPHPIWSKRISRHMSGGTLEGGYDLPGIGWVSYFASNGAALHSTYWHNDYGRPKSHGCLNCRPEDAKWIFRWTMPHVPYEPGDLTVDWENRGTTVDIREGK